MAGAGDEGQIFAGKHQPFTNQEIVTMLGVYILDGLALLPKLVQKMQPQSKSPTNGNDRITDAIGPGSSRSIAPLVRGIWRDGRKDAPPPKKHFPHHSRKRRHVGSMA